MNMTEHKTVWNDAHHTWECPFCSLVRDENMHLLVASDDPYAYHTGFTNAMTPKEKLPDSLEEAVRKIEEYD